MTFNLSSDGFKFKHDKMQISQLYLEDKHNTANQETNPNGTLLIVNIDILEAQPNLLMTIR